jgi:hypothetical protein
MPVLPKTLLERSLAPHDIYLKDAQRNREIERASQAEDDTIDLPGHAHHRIPEGPEKPRRRVWREPETTVSLTVRIPCTKGHGNGGT